MSKKSAKIAELIERHRGQKLSPYYLGYFELFNAQLFYESHDVLEELWLQDRRGANGDFYKGLIQLAGAFVHLQKDSAKYPRLRPAAALFKLAQNNFAKYPRLHESLNLAELEKQIARWRDYLPTKEFESNPLEFFSPPQIILSPDERTEVSEGNKAKVKRT